MNETKPEGLSPETLKVVEELLDKAYPLLARRDEAKALYLRIHAEPLRDLAIDALAAALQAIRSTFLGDMQLIEFYAHRAVEGALGEVYRQTLHRQLVVEAHGMSGLGQVSKLREKYGPPHKALPPPSFHLVCEGCNEPKPFCKCLPPAYHCETCRALDKIESLAAEFGEEYGALAIMGEWVGEYLHAHQLRARKPDYKRRYEELALASPR